MQFLFTNFASEAAVRGAAEQEATGIATLGLNGKAFLIQLITFVLVFLVLRRFAFTPILKVLNERRETIESGVTLGEQMQKERVALDTKVADTLRDARKQADVIVAEAQDAAREAVKAAETTARAKADSILAEAHERAEQDIARMRTALEVELVGLVSDATEAIIDEKLDAKKDATLISKSLKGQNA